MEVRSFASLGTKVRPQNMANVIDNQIQKKNLICTISSFNDYLERENCKLFYVTILNMAYSPNYFSEIYGVKLIAEMTLI